MQLVRIRAAGIVALLVVVSVITSALATCLPGAMASMPTMADEHMTCGHESDSGYGVSAVPADCCKSIEPVVLTKIDSLKPPVRGVLRWMTSTMVAATLPLPISVTATVSPSPPDSVIAGGPPRYVVLRTFLI